VKGCERHRLGQLHEAGSHLNESHPESNASEHEHRHKQPKRSVCGLRMLIRRAKQRCLAGGVAHCCKLGCERCCALVARRL